jgi:hypothetical protein
MRQTPNADIKAHSHPTQPHSIIFYSLRRRHKGRRDLGGNRGAARVWSNLPTAPAWS